uniref:DUF2345 domain-containing protein n=1 Tax=Chromobacterium amazonense TaxID=1382803 RepID=UPI003F792DE1
NHTTGRRWLHNVGQHISLFVAGVKDKVAVKLIAAKGKVQIQAQSDAMELTADKDVTITSVKGKVQIASSQEILLAGGGGGYIRIAGGNIEVHCPGEVSIKGASHGLSGPASMGISMPWFKESHDHSVQFLVHDDKGNVMSNFPYSMHTKCGLEYHGVTDKNGLTERVYAAADKKFNISKRSVRQVSDEELEPPAERWFDEE